MLLEVGRCTGIENSSRNLTSRAPGERPACLLDYFPDDYLCILDESHQTLPQLGGMYEGDRSRKQTLVDYGFRLPSALDNRPLRIDEFMGLVPRMVRSEEHTSELQSHLNLVCRLLLEKTKPSARTSVSSSTMNTIPTRYPAIISSTSSHHPLARDHTHATSILDIGTTPVPTRASTST